MAIRIPLLFGLALSAAMTQSCGNDDGGPIGAGVCTIDAPTFTSIYENRLATNTCASGGCHDAFSAQAGLNFEKDQADVLADLVDVASTSAPAKVRVVAGDPDQSYFYEKLVSANPGGLFGRMPPSGQLPPCEIDAVGAWITNGANND